LLITLPDNELSQLIEVRMTRVVNYNTQNRRSVNDASAVHQPVMHRCIPTITFTMTSSVTSTVPLNWYAHSPKTRIHCVSKTTLMLHTLNFIWAIFGRDVADRVCYQMMIW